MTQQSFNPPPNWPEPPHDGWLPPADFRPQHSWGPVPAGWRLWFEDRTPSRGAGPLDDSEEVPASGARPRARVAQFPVAVLNPGMWSENHLQHEDYGFPPAKPRKHRPRLRLGMTITVTVLGLVLAALTAIMFVQLVDFGIDDLTGVLGEAGGRMQLVTVLPGMGAFAPVHG